MSIISYARKLVGIQDSAGWFSWFGGSTSTGKTVTTDTAMTVAVAFGCIRLLSESGGMLPAGIYRKLASGGREAVLDHPAYALVHTAPSPDMTAVEFWEAVIANMATEGNAFALKIIYAGRVTSLELLDPRTVSVSRYPSTHELRYRFTWRGKAFDVGQERVLHFRGFGKGGDVGVSVIRYGANTIGIAMAADDTAGKQFRSSASKAGFIQTDKVLTEPQREQFGKSLDKFQTSDHADKLMLLEGGFKFEATGINPNDLQLLMARGYSGEQVCSLFRVPPDMVMYTKNSTGWGTGLEQQVIRFLTFSLSPYLKKIEARVDAFLLSDVDRAAGLYFRFNLDALLRADSAARALFYASALQNGWMNRNGVRAKEEEAAIPGGDVYTVQSNLVPLDRLGELLDKGGGADANAVKQALRRWLELDSEQTSSHPAGHNGGPSLDETAQN